jgi:uncharacterized membrane protein
MSARLKSRKFWIAIISGILVVLNQGLGLHIDNATILSFAGIVMSYIFGQGYVDGQYAKSNQTVTHTSNATHTTVEVPASPAQNPVSTDAQK